MKFLSFFSISSGANSKPKPTAIPQTASDQLLFITIDENREPNITTTPKLVVTRLFQILDIGFLWIRDREFVFFFGDSVTSCFFSKGCNFMS